jgi:hypothetical protein
MLLFTSNFAWTVWKHREHGSKKNSGAAVLLTVWYLAWLNDLFTVIVLRQA